MNIFSPDIDASEYANSVSRLLPKFIVYLSPQLPIISKYRAKISQRNGDEEIQNYDLIQRTAEISPESDKYVKTYTRKSV